MSKIVTRFTAFVVKIAFITIVFMCFGESTYASKSTPVGDTGTKIVSIAGQEVSVDQSTKLGRLSGIQDIYAISNLSGGVYNMDGTPIMYGSTIANNKVQGLITDYLGSQTLMVLSKAPGVDRPTITLLSPFLTDGKLTITPPATQEWVISKVAQGTNEQQDHPENKLWALVTYSGSNFDLTFGGTGDINVEVDSPDFVEQYFGYVGWLPGEVFGIPTERTVKVRYVDADTGNELSGLPEVVGQTTTSYLYTTAAKAAPKGYYFAGKLKPDSNIKAGTRIPDNQIDATISNTMAYYDQFDSNSLNNYRINRYIPEGQTITTVLQSIGAGMNYQHNELYRVGNNIGLTIHRRVDQSPNTDDGTASNPDILPDITETIPYDKSISPANEADFWETAVSPSIGSRTYYNNINTNDETTITYVYKKANSQNNGDNSNTNTIITVPGPTQTIAAKGTVVYATNPIYMYKNKDFNPQSRIEKYSKKPRINRPMFVVLNHFYSRSGNLRYQVRDVNHDSRTAGKTGYITANGNYVLPVYYSRANEQVTIINPRGVNAYKHVNLTKKAAHYKQGERLRVVAIKKHHLTTRFVLKNGDYITANRKLVQTGTTKVPKSIKTKTVINRYSDINLSKQNGRYVRHKTLKILGWDYSQANNMNQFGTLRYRVAGGYITANSKHVTALY